VFTYTPKLIIVIFHCRILETIIVIIVSPACDICLEVLHCEIGVSDSSVTQDTVLQGCDTVSLGV